MDRCVVVEAAVPVYDVATADEAIRIAISKVGESLNPDLNYVEIEPGERTSPDGEELEPAFIVADEALVALELEMDVFDVDGAEHASRIARTEIGQRLESVPLKVIAVDELTDEDDATGTASPPPDDRSAGSEATPADDEETGYDDGSGESGDEDEELLPEFEDMV